MQKQQSQGQETVSSLDEATPTVESEEDVYLCRVCDKEYTDEMESDMESWIECDSCEQWFLWCMCMWYLLLL